MNYEYKNVHRSVSLYLENLMNNSKIGKIKAIDVAFIHKLDHYRLKEQQSLTLLDEKMYQRRIANLYTWYEKQMVKMFPILFSDAREESRMIDSLDFTEKPATAHSGKSRRICGV